MQNIHKRQIINILLCVSFLLGFSLLWLKLFDANSFPIKSVKVEGAYPRVSASDLQSVVMPYVKTGFFAVDVDKIRERLKHFSWIDAINISRVWPDTIVIHIKEKQAVARWQHALLDEKGDLFTQPGSPSRGAGLPYLEGPIGKHNEVLHQYRDLQTMLQTIHLQIAELHLTKRGSWWMQLNNGMQVMLGKNKPGQRLRRFVSIYNDAFEKKGIAISRVDLRYPSGFAVKARRV